MGLSPASLELYSAYKVAYDTVTEYSLAVQGKISRELENQPYEIHIVAARAKHPESLLSKLRNKQYSNPKIDITDLVGVRVITYYDDDVDRVVAHLRKVLVIDEARSIDKRQRLQEAEFGYQSVHLIADPPDVDVLGIEPPAEVGVIELQVRSLFEHAWAETQHEIMYKSGIDFPLDVKRRIHAIAGALHILGRELTSLREEQDQLVKRHIQHYSTASEGDIALDASRLAALMQVVSPNGQGWNTDPSESGRGYVLRDAAVCVEALGQAGVTSGNALRNACDIPRFTRLREAFAARKGIGLDDVSHFALVVLAVAAVERKVLDDFPDLLEDVDLAQVVVQVR